MPLCADIHFSPRAAMEAALHVEKVRINPGNFSGRPGRDGSEISEPAMLDEEGFWIPDATPDDAYFLTVKKYPPADYSILPGVS